VPAIDPGGLEADRRAGGRNVEVSAEVHRGGAGIREADVDALAARDVDLLGRAAKRIGPSAVARDADALAGRGRVDVARQPHGAAGLDGVQADVIGAAARADLAEAAGQGAGVEVQRPAGGADVDGAADGQRTEARAGEGRVGRVAEGDARDGVAGRQDDAVGA